MDWVKDVQRMGSEIKESAARRRRGELLGRVEPIFQQEGGRVRSFQVSRWGHQRSQSSLRIGRARGEHGERVGSGRRPATP